MKTNFKKVAIGALVLVVAQLVHGYRKEQVAVGQMASFKADYYVNPVENGVWHQYAVDLTPAEKNALQRAVKSHVNNEMGFNKRISQDDIQLILSGCKKNVKGFCSVIESVLSDFVGRTFNDLFSSIGLSREI